jgi:hypothetical protein
MLFKTFDGTSFRLKIIGYAEPYARSYGRANLLRQKINVNSTYGAWQAEFPGFTTYEAAWLAEWLEQVASGSAIRQRLDFLEPSLAFTLLDLPAGHGLRIYLEGQSRPAWMYGRSGGTHDTWLDFPHVTHDELFQAAIELRKALLKYPERKRHTRLQQQKALNLW